MVSRRTPACQYGSRAEFAIIVERHDAPIETSSPSAVVSRLWHATQFSDVVNSVSGLCGSGPGGGVTNGPTGGATCAFGAAYRNAIIQIADASGSSRFIVIDLLNARTGTGRRRTSPTGST